MEDARDGLQLNILDVFLTSIGIEPINSRYRIPHQLPVLLLSAIYRTEYIGAPNVVLGLPLRLIFTKGNVV